VILSSNRFRIAFIPQSLRSCFTRLLSRPASVRRSGTPRFAGVMFYSLFPHSPIRDKFAGIKTEVSNIPPPRFLNCLFSKFINFWIFKVILKNIEKYINSIIIHYLFTRWGGNLFLALCLRKHNHFLPCSPT